MEQRGEERSKDGLWWLDSWELPQPIKLIGVVIFGDNKGWRGIVLGRQVFVFLATVSTVAFVPKRYLPYRACSVRNMVLSEPLVQRIESLLGDGN
jgi:hypothetical protein